MRIVVIIRGALARSYCGSVHEGAGINICLGECVGSRKCCGVRNSRCQAGDRATADIYVYISIIERHICQGYIAGIFNTKCVIDGVASTHARRAVVIVQCAGLGEQNVWSLCQWLGECGIVFHTLRRCNRCDIQERA